MSDSSRTTPHIDLEAFCKKYQLKDYYSRIMDKLNNTDIKSAGGVLLQLILDKSLFDKTVYASLPGGRQRSGSSWITKNMPHIEEFDDKTLTELQFRVILTDDFLLNPKNPEVRRGFKAYAYTQEQKALDEYQTDVDEFFDDIAKELKQKKKEGQITRTWGEYFRSFFAKHDSGQPRKK
jgi:hypothetical protein